MNKLKIRKKKLILLTLVMLFAKSNYSQETPQLLGEKLATILNHNFSDSITLKLYKNKADLKINNLSKLLDLRHLSEITQDSISKNNSNIRPNTVNKQTDAVYWQYSFEPVTSVKTSFTPNKWGKLFFTLTFSPKDTITSHSKLNQYTSHHKLSDSTPHKVFWLGEKYISVLLHPEITKDKVYFNVLGITISGKFTRQDLKPIDKYYSKILRQTLKREFKRVFNELLIPYNANEGSLHITSKK